MSKYMDEYYIQLVGKKITGIVKSPEDDFSDEIYGLKFGKDMVVWILCDPEGNGPGFLEIEGGKK